MLAPRAEEGDGLFLAEDVLAAAAADAREAGAGERAVPAPFSSGFPIPAPPAAVSEEALEGPRGFGGGRPAE